MPAPPAMQWPGQIHFPARLLDAPAEWEAVMLDALFTQSPAGLAVLDNELRVVRVNTATPAMQGMREQGVVGRSLPGSHHVVEEEAAKTLVREVLDSDVPAHGHILRARPPAHHGQERQYELSVFRLNNSHGGVLGAAITVVDVTDRERARNRLGIRDAVRERVGRTLDVVVTCRELAEVPVPAFADVAVVEVVDSVIRGDDPPPSPLPGGVPLRRAAFRSGAGEHQPEAIRWETYGACPPRPPSARPWPTCCPGPSPWTPAFRGRPPTQPAPGPSTTPARTPSWSFPWPCAAPCSGW
ncbi:PAS domain-containing protein [Streptomyces sp. R41]|uniref:PAS domain-containing protein n=1 Tax=Streptomyces sp. R41 TaxID=3238632 RepID=A0AB39RTX7_9ACTN